jgi:hypothetical protein
MEKSPQVSIPTFMDQTDEYERGEIAIDEKTAKQQTTAHWNDD